MQAQRSFGQYPGRRVFSNGDAGEDACEPDAPFAYVSNGNIVITAGVYVLRLVNEDDVKVQKIVIR